MPRAVSAIMFSPRGGSAHVARTLVRQLPRAGWDVRLVSGSRPELAAHGDARRFYAEADLQPVELGPEGVPGRSAPMHPSYEDRPGAPDAVFAALDDLQYERHVRAWAAALGAAGAAVADLIHLHHLTPLNEAALRVAPATPVVGQLHGTELAMLEHIAAGPPPGWRFAERWRRRMVAWAARCVRLLVAPGAGPRAIAALGVDPARLVEVPNGIDVRRFRPHAIDRAAHWRRHLVEEPRGWLPEEPPGSLRYSAGEIESLEHGTVLLYAGRFTEVKRVGRLIEAFCAARPSLRGPAGLVLVGGHPGEFEGEHPADAIRRLGARDVFLAGWHGQEGLPDFLAAADAIVLPSRHEQFGLALAEGMACGLPAIATRTIGAGGIVEDGCSGWLVPVDEPRALAEAIVSAVNDPAERRRRGELARRAIVARYSEEVVGAAVARAFDEAARPLPTLPPAPPAQVTEATSA